jgi:hypothetical protein
MASLSEIIFFVGVGVLFYILSSGILLIKKGSMGNLAKYITPFAFTLVAVGLFYLMGLGTSRDGFCTSTGPMPCSMTGSCGDPAAFSVKAGCNTPTNDLFQVSEAALCRGGLYLHTGNSPQNKRCQELITSEGGDRLNCPNGEHGRPINFEFTPESSDTWQNERCNQ